MSIRKVGSLIFFCLYIFLVFNRISPCNNKDPNFQLTHPLKTGKMAFESALKFLGNKNIIRLDSTNYTAVPTVISDTNTAYTRDIISDRPAWKVIISSVAINVCAYNSDVRPDYIMNFRMEVILDSLYGQCLLIRALNPSKINYERCELDTTLPFQFKDIEYRGLPDHYPRIGFAELLGRKGVLADATRETIGIYIEGVNRDKNMDDYDEYPHWILTQNGLTHYKSGTGLEYTNLRIVINDQTNRNLLRSFLGKPQLMDSILNRIPE